jgi:hypothetical protein
MMLLANYEWNIFIRGILFPGIMFMILCGSTYVILSTNVGNRLGFLLAATGLAGWMFLMSIAWMLYGIGLRGADPSWVVKSVITDTKNLGIAQNANVSKIAKMPFDPTWCRTDKDLANDPAIKKAEKLPEGRAQEKALAEAEEALNKTFEARRKAVLDKTGWEPLCVGTGQRGDGQSTVDSTLVTKKKDPTLTPQAIFKESSEYASISAYRQGGDNELFTIGTHGFFLRHSPHWFVIQVQPFETKEVFEQAYGPGRVKLLKADGTPEGITKTEMLKTVDMTKPITSVVMIRDQGSRRQPPFILFLSSGVMFAILASVLHQRDKQVMSIMAKSKK